MQQDEDFKTGFKNSGIYLPEFLFFGSVMFFLFVQAEQRCSGNQYKSQSNS